MNFVYGMISIQFSLFFLSQNHISICISVKQEVGVAFQVEYINSGDSLSDETLKGMYGVKILLSFLVELPAGS